MATTKDPIRQIFLAGVGALAMGAEKSKEIVDQLVQKGQITVDEGKEITEDLGKQAEKNFDEVRDNIIAAHMRTMDKEQRDAFAACVAEMAATINGDEALQAKQDEEVQAAAEQQAE